jgi:hypothetical protein
VAAQPSDGKRLIGTLASGQHLKVASGNRLPALWQRRHLSHEIHVETADDDHAFHGCLK